LEATIKIERIPIPNSLTGSISMPLERHSELL